MVRITDYAKHTTLEKISFSTRYTLAGWVTIIAWYTPHLWVSITLSIHLYAQDILCDWIHYVFQGD